jgi:uncharacterized protein (DUF58 family)
MSVMNTTSFPEAVYPSLSALIALREKAKGLSISRIKKSSNDLSGDRLSSVRGRGMDFAEVREYQPGDDIRHMDWRVTARSNQPHVKLYQEERERPVFILLDFQSRLFFGSRVQFKSVAAAKAAALIAWMTVNHGDRLGAFILTDQEVVACPAQSRQSGALQFLNKIVEYAPRQAQYFPETRLSIALQTVEKNTRSGSLLYIITDYMGYNSDIQIQLQRLSQHRDVVSLFIYDPLEAELPEQGFFQFTDQQERLTFDASDASTRLEYRKHFQQRRAALIAQHSQCSIGWIELSTQYSVVDHLRAVLSGGRRKPG